MSSGGTPASEKLDTRYSTPAPELDDHRPRRSSNSPVAQKAAPPQPRLDIPAVAVQEATPRGSVMDPHVLLQVDDALRDLSGPSPGHQSIARDFENENAVSDTSDVRSIVSPGGRRGSARRDTGRRGGRPRDVMRQHDRSRDSSSDRSSSPANSVEAFAEPRRRQRANTVGSLPDSVDLQRYRVAGSHVETRRPTLSNISVPANLQSRAGTYEDPDRNASFTIDDEPGKTYKIDFEELEEFVALCKQGKISNTTVSSTSSDEAKQPRVFHDQRGVSTQNDVPNAVLNGETFYETPIQAAPSAETAVEKNQPPPPPKTKAIDRFTFFSTDVQKPKFATSLVDFTADGTKFSELFDVGPEGGVWWLDVLNPTQAELDVIASAFQIHRLTKEDIETQEPREKVELFRDYYFVCFRSFNMNKLSEDFLDPIHLYIIVTTDGVLSFQYTANPHAHNVRRRISKVGDFVSLGPDYICYALIDDIVDSFAPIIRDAEEESENIEDSVFIARGEDFGALLRQIGEARKRVLNMMRLLGGKADVIKGFAKRCNEQFEITPRGDIGLYLGDIQDHVVTMMSNLGHVEKMLSRSHANYLAQLSVDHLLKGNSTNKNLAKITVLATILVPLNLITGLFGMNVHVPGMGKETFAWFGGIVGVIVTFVCTSLVVARRMKLI